MEGLARQKVPGGKLLIIKAIYSEKIDSIQILGDFFLYPESSLDILERAIIGTEVNFDENKLASKISDIAIKNKIEMIGITPQSIAQTIKMAVKQ